MPEVQWALSLSLRFRRKMTSMTSVRIITLDCRLSETRSKFHENPHPSVKRVLMPEKALELLRSWNGVPLGCLCVRFVLEGYDHR